MTRTQPHDLRSVDQPAHADIIILDWNRPDFTIAAIRSALEQSSIRRTVWVVDQGSTRENRGKLAAFCEGRRDVHVHWLGRNVGVAEGRNIASRLGSAPYIIGLDNDALFTDSECVARAVARLEAQPQLGGLAFRIIDADTGSEEPYWDYPAAHLHTEHPWFEVTRFLGGGHALRRAAFERAGGYDAELFFGGEERDIAWRMLNLGYRMRLYRDLSVVHNSVTDSKLRWSDSRYYFLVRNSLYINHKFGAGPVGFLRGAASFGLRGLRNGLCKATLRGIGEGLALSVGFSLSRQDHSRYELSPDVQRYIAATDHKAAETKLQKLRRQLTVLPKV
jgi:GT2 family glycosyltransferase